MQGYLDIAEKKGIVLQAAGKCQFCGANTTRGIHECMEIFNLGFPHLDYSKKENHPYRFMSVDVHTLQHPEIHGRWNNHFHLSRLHLVFAHNVEWSYNLSPKLSDRLNAYKLEHPNEILPPPAIGERGGITVVDVLQGASSELESRKMVKKWAMEVYRSWRRHHPVVEPIAQDFLEKNQGHFTIKR